MSFPASAELSLSSSTRRSPLERQTATEAGIKSLTRVVHVKLEKADSETWKSLRDVASAAARYANEIVNGLMGELRGWRPPLELDRDGKECNWSQYARANFKADLSGAAYSAVEREVRGQWNRHRKRIWAGFQQPPRYTADRALSVRWDGVRVIQTEDGFALRLGLIAAATAPPFILPIERNVRRDEYLAPRLAAFASGQSKVLKCALTFRPHLAELHAHLAYTEQVEMPPPGERVATLAMLDDGRLLLRVDHIPPQDYTYRVHQLRHMKEHYAGIVARLRRRGFGRGKGDARRRRKLLAKSGSYNGWSESYGGPLHQMSADMISWCREHGAGTIIVLNSVKGDAKSPADWPAARLITMLMYKAEPFGILVTENPDLANESTERSFDAEVKRNKRRSAKARKAVRDLSSQLEV